MGFKLKHVFKGPAKVLNSAGNAGIFGQRGDHFRVAGIKVGKDLAPVVQTVAVVATAVVATPAVATTLAVTTETAAIITATAASTTVAGLSGANESQMANTAVTTAGTAIVGNVATGMETVAEKVAVNVGGNMAVATATGNDPVNAAIMATSASVGANAEVSPLVSNTIGRSVVAIINDEDPVKQTSRGLANDIGAMVGENIGSAIANNSDIVQSESGYSAGDGPEMPAEEQSMTDEKPSQTDENIDGTQKSDINPKKDEVLFKQIDGTICTFEEQAKATFVDQATELFPVTLPLLLTTDVKLECARKYNDGRVGDENMEQPSKTMQYLSDVVTNMRDEYAATRSGL